MTAPATVPAQRPFVYVYVVVDKRDPQPQTPTVIEVGKTRAECREKISHDPDADFYRIRRSRATLYES